MNILFAALACAALCVAGCSGPVDDTPTPDPVPLALYGTWDYWTVTRTYPHQTGEDAVITGSITFTNNHRWSMARDIGGVASSGAGPFTAEGAYLLLTYDGKDSTEKHAFVLSNEIYGTGTRKTLTMTMYTSDSVQYKFSLKEHK